MSYVAVGGICLRPGAILGPGGTEAVGVKGPERNAEEGKRISPSGLARRVCGVGLGSRREPHRSPAVPMADGSRKRHLLFSPSQVLRGDVDVWGRSCFVDVCWGGPSVH